MGKTQTALEYTYVNEGSYDGIFWLRSKSEALLSASFAAIAVRLHLREMNELGADDNINVERAREWLETAGEITFLCVSECPGT
jgi:hypothetical protein